MSDTLKKRIGRLEENCQVSGDWRQFGNGPRDYPDWALVAALLWALENHPQFRDSAELVEVRRLYDAGKIDAAFNLLGPIIRARVLVRRRYADTLEFPHPDANLRNCAVVPKPRIVAFVMGG